MPEPKLLEVGDPAPSFTLPDDNGQEVSLADFKGKRVVLYFYPKDLTSGCTVQACDFRDARPGIVRKKAVVLGISPDPVKMHGKFRDKHELNFPLLADEGSKVCTKYGVWKEKSMYGRKYMGVERTTFVISPAGKIEAVYRKVKVAGHVDEVVKALGKA